MNHRRIALNILLSSTLLISTEVQGQPGGGHPIPPLPAPDQPKPLPGGSITQAQQHTPCNDEDDEAGNSAQNQQGNTNKQQKKAKGKEEERQAQLQQQLEQLEENERRAQEQQTADNYAFNQSICFSDQEVQDWSKEIKVIMTLLCPPERIFSHMYLAIRDKKGKNVATTIRSNQCPHINVQDLPIRVICPLMQNPDRFMDWFTSEQRTALLDRFLNEVLPEQRISILTNRFIVDWADWLTRFMGWFEEGQRPTLLNRLIGNLTLEGFTSLLTARSKEENERAEEELEYLRGRIEAQKAREAARTPIQRQEIQRVGSEEHQQTFLREENHLQIPSSQFNPPPLHSIGLQPPLERHSMPRMRDTTDERIPGEAVFFQERHLYLNQENNAPRFLPVSAYNNIDITGLDDNTIVAIAQNTDVLNQFRNYERNQILERFRIIRQGSKIKLVLPPSTPALGSGKKPQHPFTRGFGGGGSGQKR